MCGRNTFVPLTSAHLHYKTSGRDAAALLMDLLNDPHTVPRSQMLGMSWSAGRARGTERYETM